MPQVNVISTYYNITWSPKSFHVCLVYFLLFMNPLMNCHLIKDMPTYNSWRWGDMDNIGGPFLSVLSLFSSENPWQLVPNASWSSSIGCHLSFRPRTNKKSTENFIYITSARDTDTRVLNICTNNKQTVDM